jgi:hypothetical protein
VRGIVRFQHDLDLYHGHGLRGRNPEHGPGVVLQFRDARVLVVIGGGDGDG